MTEAELRAYVKEQVESRGWTTIMDLSSHRRMPSGLKGAPDLVFIAPPGIVVFFEAKAPGKTRRPAQVTWHERIKAHLCYHVRYVVAESWIEFYATINDLIIGE
jgi:hypothetical protein